MPDTSLDRVQDWAPKTLDAFLMFRDQNLTVGSTSFANDTWRGVPAATPSLFVIHPRFLGSPDGSTQAAMVEGSDVAKAAAATAEKTGLDAGANEP